MCGCASSTISTPRSSALRGCDVLCGSCTPVTCECNPVTNDLDLRLGDWRDVLADVECDVMVTDPPYGHRTHDGHNRVLRYEQGGQKLPDQSDRSLLRYSHWTASDVREFVASWAPRTRGWFVALTSHDLFSAWEESLEAEGRYVFQPIPCVIRGMTVRISGDGPSSWAVWLVASRPRTRQWSTWGTLPGAYYVTRGTVSDATAPQIIGGKPLQLMLDIVGDYSRQGDLVCDPCAGLATTGVAARALRRRFVGSEIDADTFKTATERLAGGIQQELIL